MTFHNRIFVVSSFKVVWPRHPRKELGEYFQRLYFWNQYVPLIKMHCRVRYLLNFGLKIRSGQVWAIPYRASTGPVQGQKNSNIIYGVSILQKKHKKLLSWDFLDTMICFRDCLFISEDKWIGDLSRILHHVLAQWACIKIFNWPNSY